MDQLKIVCDNISMLVLKVHNLITPPGFPSNDTTRHYTLKPLQPEWDVLNKIWHSVKEWQGLPITRIKGHQDSTTPVESLSLEAVLNVQADALAGGSLLATRPNPETPIQHVPEHTRPLTPPQ